MNVRRSIIMSIKDLARRGRYDDALAVLDANFPDKLLCAETYVLKGSLIILSSDRSPYGLNDAKVMFEKAMVMLPDSDDAVYELGMYYLNVLDNAGIAKEYLRKAENILKQKLFAVRQAIDEALDELVTSGNNSICNKKKQKLMATKNSRSKSLVDANDSVRNKKEAKKRR